MLSEDFRYTALLEKSHDLVFYENRSTPQVVSRGASAKPKNGYGKVTRRRPATPKEETINRGDWLRVDESGKKGGEGGYKKTKYRPQLVKSLQESDFRCAELMKAKKVPQRPKGPIDGDGDGKVYDGTRRERPATPAEIARGAAARAGGHKGRAKVPRRPQGLPSGQKGYTVSADGPDGHVEFDVKSKDGAIKLGERLASDSKYTNVVAKPKRIAGQSAFEREAGRPMGGQQKFKRKKPKLDWKPREDVGDRLERIAPDGQDNPKNKSLPGWKEGEAVQVGHRIEHEGNIYEAKANFDGGAMQPPKRGAKRGNKDWKLVGPAGDDGNDDPPSEPPKADAKDPSKSPSEVDYKAAKLLTDDQKAAGRAWHSAQMAAASGDREKYEARMNEFLDLEAKNGGERWGNDVMDRVDDWYEGTATSSTADKYFGDAGENMAEWGRRPGDMRAERGASDGGVDPSENLTEKQLQARLEEHLDSGGGLTDAPHGGNILQAVLDRQDRFTIRSLGTAGGMSTAQWIVDNDRDDDIVEYQANGKTYETDKELYFLKHSSAEDDVLAEVMVGSILEQFNMFQYAVPIRQADSPVDGKAGSMMLMRHVGQNERAVAVWDSANKDHGYKDGSKVHYGRANHILDIDATAEGMDQTLGELLAAGPDPGGYLRINLLDFLINNSEDRHYRNVVITADEGGFAIGPIDHGLAFWNGGNAGEAIDLQAFLNSNWRTRPLDNMLNARAILGNDRDRVVEEIRNTVQQMKAARVDDIWEGIRKQRFLPGQEDEAIAWLEIMQDKIEYLDQNTEEVADIIMGVQLPKKKGKK